jgi:hypothetical protein
MKQFDLKNWNGEVFLGYTRAVADPVKTNLIEAGVFYVDSEIALQFPAQVGGNYATRPITGLLSGDAIDLDGATNIDDGSLNTYSQGIVAIHMGKSFTEKDFTYNVTGKDFMVQVAEQVEQYWRKQEQKKMLSILKGIFATALAGSVISKTSVSATDDIDVTREVGGDNAELFKVVMCHSKVAKELEKIEKIEYLKYNDANGLQRPSNIGVWGNKYVIVNDLCPVADAEDSKHTYRTYFLGEKAFGYCPLPELYPAEMSRDSKTNGGQTSLITRRGMVFAPEGLSFKASALSGTNKVTNAMLETGSNWEIVHDGNGHSVDAKNIPFCAIDYTL